MTHAGLLPQWSASQAETLGREVQAALTSETSGQFLTQLFGNQPDTWRDDLDGMDRLRLIVNVLTRMRFIDSQGRLDFASKEGLDSAPEGFHLGFNIHALMIFNCCLATGLHWKGKLPRRGYPLRGLIPAAFGAGV